MSLILMLQKLNPHQADLQDFLQEYVLLTVLDIVKKYMRHTYWVLCSPTCRKKCTASPECWTLCRSGIFSNEFEHCIPKHIIGWVVTSSSARTSQRQHNKTCDSNDPKLYGLPNKQFQGQVLPHTLPNGTFGSRSGALSTDYGPDYENANGNFKVKASIAPEASEWDPTKILGESQITWTVAKQHINKYTLLFTLFDNSELKQP